MNYKMTGKFISQIIAIEAVFMLPALLISAFLGETAAMLGFVYTVAITLLLSGLLHLMCRKAVVRFSARDGLVCVGLSWIALSLLGCLPFIFSGEIPRFMDAFFETVSGFTTTGASVVADIEALSRGLVY